MYSPEKITLPSDSRGSGRRARRTPGLRASAPRSLRDRRATRLAGPVRQLVCDRASVGRLGGDLGTLPAHHGYPGDRCCLRIIAPAAARQRTGTGADRTAECGSPGRFHPGWRRGPGANHRQDVSAERRCTSVRWLTLRPRRSQGTSVGSRRWSREATQLPSHLDATICRTVSFLAVEAALRAAPIVTIHAAVPRRLESSLLANRNRVAQSKTSVRPGRFATQYD